MRDSQALPLNELPEPRRPLVRSGASALARLEELGLSLDVFVEALEAGQRNAQQATAHHAKTAAGTYRWHETVARLRAVLTAQQWQQTDEKNAPRVISPASDVSLMVATGNSKTGTRQEPSNATPKGAMTCQDVQKNGISEQQMITGLADLLVEAVPVIWVLLYFYSQEKNHIRMELSCPQPDGFKNGYIVSWKERIILPPLEFGSAELLLDAQPDTTPEIDFLIGDAEAS